MRPAARITSPGRKDDEMIDELQAALMGLRRHNLGDGPCWCSTEPSRHNDFRHVSECLAARAALGLRCSLYFPTDNTICDEPRGHDSGAHEAARLQEQPR